MAKIQSLFSDCENWNEQENRGVPGRKDRFLEISNRILQKPTEVHQGKGKVIKGILILYCKFVFYYHLQMHVFQIQKRITCWPLTSPRPANTFGDGIGGRRPCLTAAEARNEEKNAKRTLQLTNITGKVKKYSCLIVHKLMEKTNKFRLFERHTIF